MKKIVNLIVNKYNMREYGIDFMGYVINNPKKLTYHHLITPKQYGGEETIENGVVLLRYSHHYLHLIEEYDFKTFEKITKQLIEENVNGKIDLRNLYNIHRYLLEFEKKNIHNQKIELFDIYTRRFLSAFDDDVLNNIDKYELKKDLHL